MKKISKIIHKWKVFLLRNEILCDMKMFQFNTFSFMFLTEHFVIFFSICSISQVSEYTHKYTVTNYT
jgi:hypothetical protein